MKKILNILFVIISFRLVCQTISPQVINSAGQSYPNGINGNYFADNIGEPFTQTVGGNFIITQGFLQPLTTAASSVSVIHNDVSCRDKSDGNISVSVSNLHPGYQIAYNWAPASACHALNCSSVDSLKAGTYTVQVKVTYSIQGGFKTDSFPPVIVLINDLNGPCLVKIYSAVTPNGDNNNDVFQIDNITDFPENHVTIFNRWGQQVFETHGYDNVTKFWPSKDDVNKLVPSTYFYVINLGNGSSSLRGWVELIKN